MNNPNNLTLNYPGVLDDGRLFTDYVSSASMNDQIKKNNNITNNTKYKEFLVKNTNLIMKINYQNMIKENPLSIDASNRKNTSPYIFDGISDDTKPYGYESSLTKNMYLSREQLNDKKRRPLQKNI